MRPDELRQILERRPVEPIRLHITSGQTVDNNHPERAVVCRSLVPVRVWGPDERGRLVITAMISESRAGLPGIEISFKDNGRGMTLDETRQIFKPFYTRREGGTGLGLGVVKSAIQAHRGEIAVTSEPNQGATVQVWLPTDPI